MECMKPAHPPPSLRLQYTLTPASATATATAPSSSQGQGLGQGQWDVGVVLPVCVASFNEPLPLSAKVTQTHTLARSFITNPNN